MTGLTVMSASAVPVRPEDFPVMPEREEVLSPAERMPNGDPPSLMLWGEEEEEVSFLSSLSSDRSYGAGGMV